MPPLEAQGAFGEEAESEARAPSDSSRVQVGMRALTAGDHP